ncbi:MAG TPA: LLM class flavin-dependent oxidoreductase [Dehalococcoidia bacterium]|nr:LLM class flavin-dependent oxidoreductase [Dehalococcoidia bacterium]
MLSVLDQSPIRRGGTPRDAINETLRLAEVCDRLGYRRYWLAEHHNSGGLACASPEVLIPMVAARTQQIRVGSGGVMLSHYSPLKVAETFRMLEALHPGRIDLGIGRAPGSDGRTARALAHGPGALGIEHYPEQLADLYGFLTDDFPRNHPFHGIHAMPAGPEMPEIWLLGSTAESASLAAHFGWAFSFAQFISPEGGEGMIRAYKRHFKPSPLLAEPRASIGVSVTCADTEEEAERLCWSRWYWRATALGGGRGGVPPVEEALAYSYTEQEREYIEYMRRLSIHGTPEQVKARLLALGEAYGVDEFVVVTITHDFAARVHSYELLAEAFGLSAPVPPSPFPQS